MWRQHCSQLRQREYGIESQSAVAAFSSNIFCHIIASGRDSHFSNYSMIIPGITSWIVTPPSIDSMHIVIHRICSPIKFLLLWWCCGDENKTIQSSPPPAHALSLCAEQSCIAVISHILRFFSQLCARGKQQYSTQPPQQQHQQQQQLTLSTFLCK